MATEYRLSYTAAEINEKLGKTDDCVLKNQGAENVGKILVVGTDGNLTLTDLPESGDVIGVLDEANNILLSGNLANGTYTLKYENADGTYTDVGALEVGAIPEPEEIINRIKTSINADGTPYNGGLGYKTDTRMSISSGNETTSDASSLEVTGFIRVNYGDTLYIKGITIDAGSTTQTFVFYNSNFELTKTGNASEQSGVYTGDIFGDVAGEVKSIVLNASTLNNPNFNEDVAYIRMTAAEINANSIITINQPIE